MMPAQFETPKGKVINIVKKAGTNMYEINFGSGGCIPTMLSGLFTSESTAAREINKYLGMPRLKTMAKAGTKKNAAS